MPDHPGPAAQEVATAWYDAGVKDAEVHRPVVQRLPGIEQHVDSPGDDRDARRDHHGAAVVAERVRQVVSATPIRINPDTAITITVSVGVSTLRSNAEHPDLDELAQSLLHDADTALYRAKAEGRDRVVQAQVSDGKQRTF